MVVCVSSVSVSVSQLGLVNQSQKLIKFDGDEWFLEFSCPAFRPLSFSVLL